MATSRKKDVSRELDDLRRRVEELERRPPVYVQPIYVPPMYVQPYAPSQLPYAIPQLLPYIWCGPSGSQASVNSGTYYNASSQVTAGGLPFNHYTALTSGVQS